MYSIILYGPPGAGKGTQAELLSEKLSLRHISTGEILRKAVNEGTELGKKAKEIMEAGKLVSDDIMQGIVKETLENITENGFILDGFPRTVEQAKTLDRIFRDLGIDDVMIVNLQVDEDELVERLLKRGRSDDNEDVIRERLKVYRDSTEPVKEYYKDEFEVIDINGTGSVEEINENIISAVEGAIQKKN